MNINATLVVQLVVFFALVWFVMAFIWPPLIKAIDERRKEIAEGLEAAKASMDAKASSDAEIKNLLKDARQQSAQVLADAKKKAEDEIEAARIQAKAVANKEKENAESQIQVEMNQAKEALRSSVASLALEGAHKILGKEINKDVHDQMLNELIARLK